MGKEWIITEAVFPCISRVYVGDYIKTLPRKKKKAFKKQLLITARSRAIIEAYVKNAFKDSHEYGTLTFNPKQLNEH